MKIVKCLVVLAVIGMASSAFADEPGSMVFLSTKTDIMGCYFKKGEENKVRKDFKTIFSYGEQICMRAYTTGKIGQEVNMQDFVDGTFYKGFVFSWKYPEGDSGFWQVLPALAETRPLPRGKHCIKMFVTGPDADGVKPAHRRLAAQGCFTVK